MALQAKCQMKFTLNWRIVYWTEFLLIPWVSLQHGLSFLGLYSEFRIFHYLASSPTVPPYDQLFVIFLCTFDLILWLNVFWNGVYTIKVIFIQLQEFPTPPYCRCCSVTKRSDSGIAEALKTLKSDFWDPSHWGKMCFKSCSIEKKWLKIFTFAYG